MSRQSCFICLLSDTQAVANCHCLKSSLPLGHYDNLWLLQGKFYKDDSLPFIKSKHQKIQSIISNSDCQWLSKFNYHQRYGIYWEPGTFVSVWLSYCLKQDKTTLIASHLIWNETRLSQSHLVVWDKIWCLLIVTCKFLVLNVHSFIKQDGQGPKCIYGSHKIQHLPSLCYYVAIFLILFIWNRNSSIKMLRTLWYNM